MSSQTYVNGITLSDAAEWNRWDTAAYSPLTGVSGSNTIAATGPANYSTASRFPISWIQATTNTGATTLNVTPSGGAAIGAKAVFVGGVACVGGEMIAGNVYSAVYDGTQYQIVSGGYSTGTFVATLTGCTTAPTYTVTYTVVGKQVTIDVPGVTGTSNSTAKTLTGMPAGIRPATAKNNISMSSSDNGGTRVSALGNLATSGVISLYPDGSVSANWTNSGTMAVLSFTYTYTLA